MFTVSSWLFQYYMAKIFKSKKYNQDVKDFQFTTVFNRANTTAASPSLVLKATLLSRKNQKRSLEWLRTLSKPHQATQNPSLAATTAHQHWSLKYKTCGFDVKLFGSWGSWSVILLHSCSPVSQSLSATEGLEARAKSSPAPAQGKTFIQWE